MSSKNNKAENKIESFVIRSMVAGSSRKRPYPSATSELAAYRDTGLSPDEISALIQILNSNRILAVPDIEPGTPLFWVRNFEIVTMFYGGVKSAIGSFNGNPDLLCVMYTTQKAALRGRTSDPKGKVDFSSLGFDSCIFLSLDKANCELQERVRLMMGD